jgi:hypothetical protein
VPEVVPPASIDGNDAEDLLGAVPISAAGTAREGSA